MARPLTILALVVVGACGEAASSPSTSEGDNQKAPIAACDPTGVPVEFTMSPGGTLEVAPRVVHEKKCRLRVVDVRERDELGGPLGVIEGAQHVPQRRVAVEALHWDPDEPVVLVCRSGRRSGIVARELRELGLTRVASMTGGMLAYRAAGLPTVDGTNIAPEPSRSVRSPMRAVSRDDVAAHVSDRDRVRWTKAATLMLHGTQACVDGRDAHAIIGTPGGDAGELVLALATAERLSGRTFEPVEIERIFDAYLEAFGHFYMHTDDHAVAAVMDRLATEVPDALPGSDDTAAAAQVLQSPPAAAREALLQRLVDPEYIGCGHLRLMLKNADEYRVRPELVAHVIRTFYRRLWDGHPAIEFVVLSGAHEESAVVSVELDREVHPYTRIPLVSPRLADTEIFVAHPQVARFVRRENAAFLFEHTTLQGVDEAAFLAGLEELAADQLEATLGHLASDLPRYRVSFSDDTFEVVGPIGQGSNGGGRAGGAR